MINVKHKEFLLLKKIQLFYWDQFALNNIIVGNGIISGASIEELSNKIASPDACISAYSSAVNAVDSLIKLKEKLL